MTILSCRTGLTAPSETSMPLFIVQKRQLVVFPEGRINKFRKKIILKEGLYRLAKLAIKKSESITILPIGIAYSEVSPKFRSKVSICFGKPLFIDHNQNLSIDRFNTKLHIRMMKAEEIALKKVGR